MSPSITHFEAFEEKIHHLFDFDLYKELNQNNPNGISGYAFIESFVLIHLDKNKINFVKEIGMWEHLIRTISITYPFYINNKKIFKFEKELTEMLLKTDLENVDAGLVKTPFNCFYISVPESTLFYPDTDSDELCIVEGIYVNLGYGIKNNKIDYNQRLLAISLINKSSPNSPQGYFEVMKYLGFPYNKNGNIFTQLIEYLKEDPAADDKDLEKIFSFVINAILYLNSDKALIEEVIPNYIETIKLKSPKKIKRAKKKNLGISKLKHHYVGRDIVLDHKFKRQIETEKENKPSKKFSSQWIVRGHWRNQPYGERMLKRKLIWIEPFIKGNPVHEIVHKNYKVK
jgi:hypothetical protein